MKQKNNTSSRDLIEKPLSAADIPLLDDHIYHLNISADYLTPHIIVVGDPDRIPLLADHCLKKESQRMVSRRGLCTITGETKKGLPLTIVTTGMGAASAEIVINELIMLNEIDIATRTRRKTPLYRNLTIIRLGTCGSLQQKTALGTHIITRYAIGLDNTGLFYTPKKLADQSIITLEQHAQKIIDAATPSTSRFYNAIHPYGAAASPQVAETLYKSALEENETALQGITISNSGFFANQGRDISRIPITVSRIDERFAHLTLNGLKAENMDMETAFLCHFVGSLGYRVGSLCVAIANRPLNTFYYGNYEQKILRGLDIILRAFEKLQ